MQLHESLPLDMHRAYRKHGAKLVKYMGGHKHIHAMTMHQRRVLIERYNKLH